MTFDFRDWLGPYPDVLHWLPEQDRWETLDCYFTPFGGPHWQPPAGIHHFLICIYDLFGNGALAGGVDNDGAEGLINLIPYKWSVASDGTITDTSQAGLTKNDLKDYNRLFIAWEHTPADTARLKEIRDNMWEHVLPPPEAMVALRRALMPPISGSAAHRFLAEQTGERP
jgi:hypothetical protein